MNSRSINATCDTTTEEKTISSNSTYKKLAVQWLFEALRFVSSSALAGSIRFRYRQIIVVEKRSAIPNGKVHIHIILGPAICRNS